MQRRYALLAALAVIVATAACGYDSNGPYNPPGNDTSAVVGTYEATLITNTVDEKITDLLAGGLTFTMTLKENRTMTGQYVFTTGTPAPGTRFEITGTWAQDHDASVQITDHADTFVSHVRFVPSDNGLTGEGAVEASSIRMELNRRAGR